MHFQLVTMTKQTSIQSLFIFLALCLNHAAFAQVSIGASAGLLITNVNKSPLEQGEPAPEPIAGFQVTVPLEISLGRMFAIQPELMFGSHGGRQESSAQETILGVTNTAKFTARYQVGGVEIPFLAKFKFGFESLRFHLLAGPSLGINASGKYHAELSQRATLADGTVVLDNTTKSDLKPKFLPDGYDTGDIDEDEFAVNPLALGAHLGAGMSYNLGGASIFLDARLMIGLSDFRPESKDETENVVYTSQRAGVSLGVMFPL